MTNTSGCCYSLYCSWWWTQSASETCRVLTPNKKNKKSCISLIFIWLECFHFDTSLSSYTALYPENLHINHQSYYYWDNLKPHKLYDVCTGEGDATGVRGGHRRHFFCSGKLWYPGTCWGDSVVLQRRQPQETSDAVRPCGVRRLCGSWGPTRRCSGSENVRFRRHIHAGWLTGEKFSV